MTDRNIHLHLEGHVKRNWSRYTQYVFGVDPSTNVMLNCSRCLYTLVVRHCNEQALYNLLCLYSTVFTVLFFCLPYASLKMGNAAVCDKPAGQIHVHRTQFSEWLKTSLKGRFIKRWNRVTKISSFFDLRIQRTEIATSVCPTAVLESYFF